MISWRVCWKSKLSKLVGHLPRVYESQEEAEAAAAELDDDIGWTAYHWAEQVDEKEEES